MNATITLTTVSDRADAAIQALPADVDAVFVPPLLRFSNNQLKRLSDQLIERRLPSFALLSQPYMQLGTLMTGAGRSVDVTRSARRIALNLQSIALGKAPATLKVSLRQPQKLAINMATASAIGWSPRWQDLEGAVLLNEQGVDKAQTLRLVDALQRAIEAKLRLKVAEFAPLIGATDVTRARAGLRPQLGLASNANVVAR